MCLLPAFYHGFFTVLMGHSGHDVTTTHIMDALLLLVNPMAISYIGCPVHATAKEHEIHHVHPR